MSRALLIVLVLWAAIYLPGLGTLEIKGEEGRRILPAVSMLESGNYLVPQVGSEPYLRKPPLINWLVAASFKIFGARNEWAARLPSALAVLAVALAFVTIARGTLGPTGSLIGALLWLTNFGMLEKGRLIEIEALYASLTGLALVCWLSWFSEKKSAWLTWIVPWIFLGLGLLTKGPLHLFFFYAIVLGVLWQRKQLREIFRLPHWLGVALMLAIFAAWAIPFLHSLPSGGVTHEWSRQLTGRLAGEDFKLGGWLLNIPRGLGYFLPWILWLPFLKLDETTRGLRWGILISFVLVSLVPGSLARYTMPLLAPACWFLALTLKEKLRPVLVVASIIGVAMLIYGFVLTPKLSSREKVRNLGAQINAALPPGEPLFAIDPDYQPLLFYVRAPIIYLAQISELPPSARYLLMQGNKEAQALEGRPAKILPRLHLKDYRGKELTLLEVGTTR